MAKTRRVISVLLAVFMILTMVTIALPVSVSAETFYDEVVSATGLNDVSGLNDIKNGLVENVTTYKVTDRAGMDKISSLINQPVASAVDFSGYTFTLAADIDMGDLPFNPIGHVVNKTNSYTIDTDKSVAFKGTFDGNGFVLNNLTVIEPTRYGVGLFGFAQSATVKNLGIASGLIVGYNEVAVFVGWGNGTVTISNCWTAATLFASNGSDGCAAFVGRANGSKYYLNNCYNLGVICCRNSTASGLTGWCNNNDYHIWNCYNYGQMITRMQSVTAHGDQFRGFSAIMRCAVTTARSIGLNNFFRDDCGQRSYKEAKDNGLDNSYVKMDDGGVAKTTAEFASLASTLNGGTKLPNSIGAVSGYTVEFTDSSAGYPVITYKNGGTVVVKRTAHVATETFRAAYLASHSAVMAAVLANEVPCTATEWKAATAFNFSNATTIASANDLMISTLLFQGQSFANFGVNSLTFTADVDMNDQDLFPGTTWAVPYLCGAGYAFIATVEGNNHVIRNWKTFVPLSTSDKSANVNATGGLFGGSVNATVQNLGMTNGYVAYTKHASDGTAYTYPSLMIGYTSGGSSTTMSNCFATGEIHILVSAAANANNNSALLGRIMGSAANVHITDCWGNVTVYNDFEGNYSKARVVGSAAQNNATNSFTNVVYVAPGIVPGTGEANVHAYQSIISTSSVGETAWELNKTFIPRNLYWSLDGDGEVTFGTAASATYKLVFSSSLGDDVRYVNAGAAVSVPVLDGFTVDAETIPAGGTTSSFTMPQSDVTVTYTAQGIDFIYVQSVVTTYGTLNSDLFTNGAEIAALVAQAQAILDDPDNATLSDEQDLRAAEEALTLTFKNVYPYYPNYADLSKYTALGYTAKDYAITTKEDWIAAVNAGNGRTDFFGSGATFHFTNDIDFQNVQMLPFCYGTYTNSKFDGHGHVLKNVNIRVTANNNCGLIGNVAGSSIVRNLGIESGTVVSTSTNANQGTGAFTGMLNGSGRILHCWNGASVSNSASGDICVSGIAGRGFSGSVIDNCYNIGAITASNSSHVGALNDWAQTTNPSGYVTNSFNAGALTSGSNVYLVRGGTAGCIKNVWSTVAVAGITSNSTHQNSGTLSADAYASGELAYKLNTNYTSGSGDQPYYTVENGKTVFGTAANQTRKVTIHLTGVDDIVGYYNAGGVYTLDIGHEANFTINSGAGASINGDQLTMGQADVDITATLTGFNMLGLDAFVTEYEAKNTAYYVNGATFAARLADARSLINSSGFTSQEEIDALLEELQSYAVYAAAPNLPGITECATYSDAPGFMLSTPADIQYWSANPTVFTRSQVMYLANDIDMTGETFDMIMGTLASLDGRGYTLSGVSLETTSSSSPAILQNFKGDYVKNIALDSCSVAGRYGRSLVVGTVSRAYPLTLENITVTNSTVNGTYSGSGSANRMGVLMSRAESNVGAVTIRNIYMYNVTMLASCPSLQNAAFVVGQPSTTSAINVTDVVLDHCTMRDTSNGAFVNSAGVAFVFGGTEDGAPVTLTNAAVINCTGRSTSYNYTISGQLKNNASITANNILTFNNSNVTAELFRAQFEQSGTTAPGTLTCSNIYTSQAFGVWNSTSGVTQTPAGVNTGINATRFKSGEMVYDFNTRAGKALLAVNGTTLVAASSTAKAPVKVTFTTDKVSNVVYTNTTGAAINLTEEFLNSADWNTAVPATFTADTTITGTSKADNLGVAADTMAATLKGRIGANFYLNLPTGIVADEDAIVRFTMDGETIAEQAVSEGTFNSIKSYARYVFTATVAAAQMGKEIHVIVINGAGDQQVIGAYTVKSYLEQILDAPATYPAEQDIAQALLRYGAYAQKAFGYDDENLVYNVDDSELDGVDLSEYVVSTTGNRAEIGITSTKASAILATNVGLRLYVKFESGNDISDYTFTYSRDGGSDAALAPIATEDGRYYVEISDIPACYLNSTFVVNVTKGETTYSVTFGVMHYGNKLLNKATTADDVKNVIKAMNLYGTAAAVYFAS